MLASSFNKPYNIICSLLASPIRQPTPLSLPPLTSAHLYADLPPHLIGGGNQSTGASRPRRAWRSPLGAVSGSKDQGGVATSVGCQGERSDAARQPLLCQTQSFT